MKIRFFNTYEPVSAFYRDLIPHLATNDIEIEIVVSKTEYRKREDLADLFSSFANVKVTKTPNLGLQAHHGTAAKVIVTLLYTLWATIYALFSKGRDVNVFLSQPPMIPLLGYLLRLIRQQPYYCVVMDVQPQVAVVLGAVKENSPLTKLLQYLSLVAWRKAAGVIVIGRCMQETINQLGVPLERLHFVPNWANEEKINSVPVSENRLVREYGWANKFVLLYAGNIGVPQYFEDILEVAKRLQDKKSLIFAFIGGGARQKMVEKFVEDHNLLNIEILPFLHNQYSLSEILSAGNVHFASLKTEITGLAVPSKFYGILAAGRPVIYQGAAHGEVAQVVSAEGIGVTVECGDVDTLETSILRYMKEQDLDVMQGQKARLLSENKYSKRNSLDSYVSIILSADRHKNSFSAKEPEINTL